MPETPFQKKEFSTLVRDLFQSLKSDGSPLTDEHEGSVVRSLMEAFARELALCYENLDMVYRCAYLDTANGHALDNVVALLGIERNQGGYLEGRVQFIRDQPAPEDIYIPASTWVAGKNVPAFATLKAAVLPKGDKTIWVDVRALEPGGLASGENKVAPHALTLMPRPIAGIDRVDNEGELILRQQEETDAQLRERARQATRFISAGTVAALEQAARSLGLRQVRVLENQRESPGTVQLVLGDLDITPELREEVLDRANAVRPAGIPLQVVEAKRVWVQITATLELDTPITDLEQEAIRKKLTASVWAYFEQLQVGQRVRSAKIRHILGGDEAIVACHDTANIPLLEAYTKEGSRFLNKTKAYRQNNQDLLLSPSECAGLDLEEFPIRLNFESPSLKLELWVSLLPLSDGDAEAKKRRALLEKELTASLQKYLLGVAQNTGSGQAQEISFQSLIQNLGTETADLVHSLTLVHERDGRVVELQKNTPETDWVEEREGPEVKIKNPVHVTGSTLEKSNA